MNDTTTPPTPDFSPEMALLFTGAIFLLALFASPLFRYFVRLLRTAPGKAVPPSQQPLTLSPTKIVVYGGLTLVLLAAGVAAWLNMFDAYDDYVSTDWPVGTGFVTDARLVETGETVGGQPAREVEMAYEYNVNGRWYTDTFRTDDPDSRPVNWTSNVIRFEGQHLIGSQVRVYHHPDDLTQTMLVLDTNPATSRRTTLGILSVFGGIGFPLLAGLVVAPRLLTGIRRRRELDEKQANLEAD
jgi:hypothetical protein